MATRDLIGRTSQIVERGGGGIQNQLLSQATAGALGIEVVAGPVEATSCGNLITQMVATGHLPDFAAGRQLIRDSFEFTTYSPRDTAKWEAAYQRLLEIM